MTTRARARSTSQFRLSTPGANLDLTRSLPVMSTHDLQYLIPCDTVIIHLTSVSSKMPEQVRLLATRNLMVEEVGHWTIDLGLCPED